MYLKNTFFLKESRKTSMKKTTYLVFLFLFPLCINSQNPNFGIEFQLNSYSLGWERKPEVSVLSNRNFIACWYTTDSLTGESVIYGQLFSPNGTKLNTEFRLNTYSGVDSFTPLGNSVLPDSGFVVSWTNNFRDGSGTCIVAQIFNSNGQKKGDEFIVNTYTMGNQNYPDVTYINNNSFIICWRGRNSDSNIYGQIFDFDGIKTGTEFLINTNTQHYCFVPKVTNLNDSTFLACWESYNDIFFQKFNSNGIKLGSETQINTLSYARDPIITLTHEGFIVVWWGNFTHIFARRFNNDLNPVGLEFRIDDFTTGWANNDPKAIQLKNKNVVFCWDYDSDVYCQLLDSTFTKYSINFKLNDYSFFNQSKPSIDEIPGTGFISCWTSSRQSGTSDILGKIMPSFPSTRTLSSFELIHPRNDSTVFFSDPTFQWSSANSELKPYPWEILYSLHVSEDSLFQNQIIYENIMDTTLKIEPLYTGSNYYWKILAKNISGDSIWNSGSFWTFNIDSDAVATKIAKKDSKQIGDFEILTFPNPFNNKVNFKFILNYNSWIEINIFDILGRLLKKYKLLYANIGTNMVEWDGTNFSGQSVGTGIYMFSIQSKKEIKYGKLLLIK
jgi:type IX secretion system substrate protein